MALLSILLCCHKHLQSIRFLDAKYLQIISLYAYECNLECVDEVVASISWGEQNRSAKIFSVDLGYVLTKFNSYIIFWKNEYPFLCLM